MYDPQRVHLTSQQENQTHGEDNINRLGAMGSKTGACIRQAILKDREELVHQGEDHKPRDSELSTGKFDADLERVKQSRIRVQKRLIDGNEVNSSDDEDVPADGIKSGKTSTVLHFKRKFKSSVANETRRRRAGRFGRRMGDSGSSSDEGSDCSDFS